MLAQANDSVKRSLQYLTTFYDRRYFLALERAIRKQIRSLADHREQVNSNRNWTGPTRVIDG